MCEYFNKDVEIRQPSSKHFGGISLIRPFLRIFLTTFFASSSWRTPNLSLIRWILSTASARHLPSLWCWQWGPRFVKRWNQQQRWHYWDWNFNFLSFGIRIEAFYCFNCGVILRQSRRRSSLCQASVRCWEVANVSSIIIVIFFVVQWLTDAPWGSNLNEGKSTRVICSLEGNGRLFGALIISLIVVSLILLVLRIGCISLAVAVSPLNYCRNTELMLGGCCWLFGWKGKLPLIILFTSIMSVTYVVSIIQLKCCCSSSWRFRVFRWGRRTCCRFLIVGVGRETRGQIMLDLDWWFWDKVRSWGRWRGTWCSTWSFP